LKGLIDQSTEYKSVKRNSKAGDQVTIDFKGMLNGEVFEGGVASDFKMILGKGSMIAIIKFNLHSYSHALLQTIHIFFTKFLCKLVI
jgi:trigger factor